MEHRELSEEARRALALLQEQATVTVTELRGAGVSMPAQALYALQLAGLPVRRAGNRWRLADADEPPPVKPPPAPRVRRVDRP